MGYVIINRPHLIQEEVQESDGMGGTITTTKDVMIVYGLLDLLSGTDRNNIQNAITEESTHVLVLLDYTEGITDSMRVIDDDYRVYDITYSDNPAGQNNHNEILLSLKQGKIYEWSVEDD